MEASNFGYTRLNFLLEVKNSNGNRNLMGLFYLSLVYKTYKNSKINWWMF